MTRQQFETMVRAETVPWPGNARDLIALVESGVASQFGSGDVVFVVMLRYDYDDVGVMVTRKASEALRLIQEHGALTWNRDLPAALDADGAMIGLVEVKEVV